MNIDVNSAEKLKVNQTIFQNVMQAHSTSDYEKLILEFSENMKAHLPKHKFEEVINNYLDSLGAIKTMEFLGCLNKVKTELFLWQVTYENSEEDVLWQMYLVDTETEAKIEGLWFG